MTTAQLELSFGTRRAGASPSVTHRPSARNPHWWFNRMRQMVDRALDWQPVPPPRPEQIMFSGGEFRLWAA